MPSESPARTPSTPSATNRISRAMWRNYLTVGVRALAKNKTYAFINIFGLALGLAACLLILLYVRYERSYDAWMPGADRAFQLQDYYKATPNGGEEMALQMTSYASGKALVKDFPQIRTRSTSRRARRPSSRRASRARPSVSTSSAAICSTSSRCRS